MATADLPRFVVDPLLAASAQHLTAFSARFDVFSGQGTNNRLVQLALGELTPNYSVFPPDFALARAFIPFCTSSSPWLTCFFLSTAGRVAPEASSRGRNLSGPSARVAQLASLPPFAPFDQAGPELGRRPVPDLPSPHRSLDVLALAIFFLPFLQDVRPRLDPSLDLYIFGCGDPGATCSSALGDSESGEDCSPTAPEAQD